MLPTTMKDVSLQDSLVITTPQTNLHQKESRTVAETITDVSESEFKSMSTSSLSEGHCVSNIMQSGELRTALVRIPSTDFRIEQEINRGAFGVVFEAQWNGTDVAAKQLAVKRFKRMMKLNEMLARELEINFTCACNMMRIL